VACPAVPHLPTLSHKWHDFQKKTLLNIKCLFGVSVQLLCETLLIIEDLSEIWSKIYIGLHVKCRILVRFQQNLIFSTDFLKAIKYQISRKSVTWEPRVPCGRSDRHDGNSRFTKFCKRNKTKKKRNISHCQNWYRVPQVENCCTNTFLKQPEK